MGSYAWYPPWRAHWLSDQEKTAVKRRAGEAGKQKTPDIPKKSSVEAAASCVADTSSSSSDPTNWELARWLPDTKYTFVVTSAPNAKGDGTLISMFLHKPEDDDLHFFFL